MSWVISRAKHSSTSAYYRMACRCFWDADSDSYAQDVYMNVCCSCSYCCCCAKRTSYELPLGLSVLRCRCIWSVFLLNNDVIEPLCSLGLGFIGLRHLLCWVPQLCGARVVEAQALAGQGLLPDRHRRQAHQPPRGQARRPLHRETGRASGARTC